MSNGESLVKLTGVSKVYGEGGDAPTISAVDVAGGNPPPAPRRGS